MDYRLCPHYDEILRVLTNCDDLEEVNFEINEVQNCAKCSKSEGKICSLWINLSFVEDMKCKMSIIDAETTIYNLDEQMKEIANKLISNLNIKNNF